MSCDNKSLLYLVFQGMGPITSTPPPPTPPPQLPVTAKATARESASSVIKVPLRRENKNDYSFPGFYPFSD